MKFKTLIRLSGSSAITSGVLLILISISFIAGIFLGEQALSATTILIVVGRVFEVFAIMGLFALQYQKLGRMGLLGFCLMIYGLLVDLFPPTGRVIFTLGLLLLTIAYIRIQALPGWLFIVWLLSSILILVSSILLGTIMLSIGIFSSGVALFGVGIVLRKKSKFI